MCLVCEQFDHYIERLNVSPGSPVIFAPEEVQDLREMLADDKDLYVDVHHYEPKALPPEYEQALSDWRKYVQDTSFPAPKRRPGKGFYGRN